MFIDLSGWCLVSCGLIPCAADSSGMVPLEQRLILPQAKERETGWSLKHKITDIGGEQISLCVCARSSDEESVVRRGTF